MEHDSVTLLDRRKTGFEQFQADLVPALVRFIAGLGIDPAREVLGNAETLVGPVESALAEQQIASEEDRVWLLVHLTYFVGEYFVQRYGGCWYVDEVEGSRFFARYVVGRFRSPMAPAAMVDPSVIAQTFVDTSPPRSLRRLLDEADAKR